MGEERSSDLTDSPRHELKGPGERNIALSELNMKTSKREKKDEIFKKTKSSGEIINTKSDDGLSEKSLTLSVLDESVGDAISLDHREAIQETDIGYFSPTASSNLSSTSSKPSQSISPIISSPTLSSPNIGVGKKKSHKKKRKN